MLLFCIWVGFFNKLNFVFNLLSGDINFVVINGLIFVGIFIIELFGIGYNLFFVKIYDCLVVFVIIFCFNLIFFVNFVIIVFLFK